MNLRKPLLATAALLLCGPDALASMALDSYATAVTGTTRQVGLAGATVASPDDYSAVFVNPAGLAGLSGDGLDFGSDSSYSENFVTDPDNPKSRVLSDPIRYDYMGVRYVTKRDWGIGFAVQTPFQIDDIFNTDTRRKVNGKNILVTSPNSAELEATLKTYTLAAAQSFLDNRLAVGLALNYQRADQDVNYRAVVSTDSYARSATHDTFTGDIGLLGRPWPWLRLALVYKMGCRIGFGESLQPVMVAFPNIKIPDRLTMGLAWLPHKKVGLYASSDYVMAMSGSSVMGSGLFPAAPGSVLGSGRYDTIDGHWGLEFIPLDEPDLTIRFWAGGYLERTGVQGGYDRYHNTAGLGFAPWFLSVNVAVDDAPLYNNFSAGVGIDIFELARRVAKHYGKKLPV
ncbi:MAG: hypothetical protein NTY77_18195 [Elusimicrobia bacterium]|nr:hypothetical protein [Elusimicrobiota bacterium]